MARQGKIARLPARVREELNRRLLDGEPAKPVLAWLNGLATVRKILAAQFGGREINDANLSAWRLGGFVEWNKGREEIYQAKSFRRLQTRVAAVEARLRLSSPVLPALRPNRHVHAQGKSKARHG